jgi:hypothetical protein
MHAESQGDTGGHQNDVFPIEREGSAAERWFSLADRAGGIRGKPRRSLWTELINGPETASRRIPALRIGYGKRWVFRLGHDRLIGKAARRVAEVLNTGDSRDLRFANYAAAHRLNFRPKRCALV